jgi:hypothetical protein
MHSSCSEKPSKESIALPAQLECILDAFLSPPKRFRLRRFYMGLPLLVAIDLTNDFQKVGKKFFHKN